MEHYKLIQKVFQISYFIQQQLLEMFFEVTINNNIILYRTVTIFSIVTSKLACENLY